jgi:adenylylsulfate kinase
MSESRTKQAFAVWITGLPASGKSTVADFLNTLLAKRGVDTAVLESDVLRKVFTPEARYGEVERDLFYRQMIFVGSILTRHGVPVIFDATANRRVYRDAARKEIPRFVEVFVDCPLEICMERDPKGIYRTTREGGTGSVPGIEVPYEPPQNPEIVVRGDRDDPATATRRIAAKLVEKGYLQPPALIEAVVRPRSSFEMG